MQQPQLQRHLHGRAFLHAAVKPNPRRNMFLLRHPAASASGAVAGIQLTVSDSKLSSRGFAVRRTVEGLDVAALNEVFARVGFPRWQEERLRRALEHNEVAWLASEATGRPVAFAHVAGDGVFNAVVEPSCQGLGLGRALAMEVQAVMQAMASVVATVELSASDGFDNCLTHLKGPFIHLVQWHSI